MDAPESTLPLKVLMTADTVGGVWTYAVELCRALSGAQVYVHLVTLGAKMQPWQAREAAQLDNATVYETASKLEWMEDPWDDVAESGEYLLSLQKVIQADLVHLNGYAHGALAWDVPVVMVAHSDVFTWFRAVKGYSPSAEWDYYFSRVNAGLRKASHIVAPSLAMITELNAIYSLQKNYSVIYNARTSGHFYAGPKQRSVLCMGRIWDEAKNVQLLIDAAPGIHYPVRIAGEHAFEHNNIDVRESNVQFLGKLNSEQIAAELSATSIYAMPAKYEPFGLSVLEAALSGCALVLGDIPSLREIWGAQAIYVNTDDPEELANVVNRLIDNEYQLKLMAEKAFSHAQNFQTLNMGKQYLNLYNQLIGNQQPASAKT